MADADVSRGGAAGAEMAGSLRRELGMVALLLAGGAAACRHGAADYIPVDVVPKAMLAAEKSAALAPGDVIGIRVWNQEVNSIDRTRVREDGKITLPFLNDVEVAGMEPADLARRLEVRLKAYIVNPVVTVVIHERRPLRVSVVGQVARPGVYELDDDAGVVNAIAAAGGLTPFADRGALFVLRQGYWADGNAAPARIRFRWDDLQRGKAPAALFHVRRGDVVVVE